MIIHGANLLALTYLTIVLATQRSSMLSLALAAIFGVAALFAGAYGWVVLARFLRLEPSAKPLEPITRLGEFFLRFRIIFTVFAAILGVLSIAYGYVGVTHDPLRFWISSAIAWAGLALRTWALCYRPSGRGVVRHGPYRWSRHPRYVGTVATLVGLIWTLQPNVVAAVFTVFVLVLHIVTILFEERRLRQQYPREYPAYRRAVPVLWWRPRIPAPQDEVVFLKLDGRGIQLLLAAWMPTVGIYTYLLLAFSRGWH